MQQHLSIIPINYIREFLSVLLNVIEITTYHILAQEFFDIDVILLKDIRELKRIGTFFE